MVQTLIDNRLFSQYLIPLDQKGTHFRVAQYLMPISSTFQLPLENRFSINLPDANILLYPEYINSSTADQLFTQLRQQASWQQPEIKLFGNQLLLPRLVAWYSDAGVSYSYSKITHRSNAWLPSLLSLKNNLKALLGTVFNSVLLNYYRNERDSISWHSDDELELGSNPVIASISLGQERQFQMKHKVLHDLKYSLPLPHGSLLVMSAETQRHWLHQIPKEKQPSLPRINLTFRAIYSSQLQDL